MNSTLNRRGFLQAFGGRVAQIAEVSTDAQGRIKVERVVCAVHCGQPINPQIIEAQVESAIMFGLSAAPYGGSRSRTAPYRRRTSTTTGSSA
jgi:CO/xanthine dehydrogenase Mo-binding subunit